MDVILQSLLSSLNMIEVHGKENISLLHGSIVLVEKLKNALGEVKNDDGDKPKSNQNREDCVPDDRA